MHKAKVNNQQCFINKSLYDLSTKTQKYLTKGEVYSIKFVQSMSASTKT